MSNSNRQIIYTDGACSNNGQGGAQGGCGAYCPNDSSLTFSEPLGAGRQTNQRAEVEAATRALERARDAGYKDVEIRTDSEYLRNADKSWINNWERNGWKDANNQPVTNRQEFERFREAKQGMNVKIERVPSQNNYADPYARAGAKGGRR